jgi:hypothetical protein
MLHVCHPEDVVFSMIVSCHCQELIGYEKIVDDSSTNLNIAILMPHGLVVIEKPNILI